LDSWFYLVECRWRKKLADCREVDGLSGQVNRSGKQTMGLFLSVEGWSPNVIEMLKQNPSKSVILMDGPDLLTILEGKVDLIELIQAKIDNLNLKAEPFWPASKLISKAMIPKP
jgi:hypothetical protein